MQLQVAILEYN